MTDYNSITAMKYTLILALLFLFSQYTTAIGYNFNTRNQNQFTQPFYPSVAQTNTKPKTTTSSSQVLKSSAPTYQPPLAQVVSDDEDEDYLPPPQLSFGLKPMLNMLKFQPNNS